MSELEELRAFKAQAELVIAGWKQAHDRAVSERVTAFEERDQYRRAFEIATRCDVTDIRSDGGTFKSPIMAIFIDGLVRMIHENGGTNCLEFRGETGDGKHAAILTIVRPGGKTMGQLRSEAVTEAERLRAAIGALADNARDAVDLDDQRDLVVTERELRAILASQGGA